MRNQGNDETIDLVQDDAVERAQRYIESRQAVKQSRKQRRANKTLRNKFLRSIKKKVRIAKSQRKEKKSDAEPIETEV